jgi:hypothetical protein
MLLNADRVYRLTVLEDAQPGALTVTELARALTDGIFAEADQATPAVGPQRRWLQQELVDRMLSFVSDSKAAADLRAAAENTLIGLIDASAKAAENAADTQTRAHFKNIGYRIRRALVD